MESTSNIIFDETRSLLGRYFNKYDQDYDGLLNLAEFTRMTEDLFGLTLDWQIDRLFFNMKYGQENLSFENFMRFWQEIRKIISDENKFLEIFRNVANNPNEDINTKHEIKFSVGEGNLTQFNIRFTINQDEINDLLWKNTNGLKFSKDQIGFIFKIMCNDPYTTRQKLEQFIKNGITILKNTIIKSNTPEAFLINGLKFQYTEDSESVIVIAQLEHKGIEFFKEFLEIFYKNYQLYRAKNTFEISLELKNDFNEFLKEGQDFLSFLKGGLKFTVKLDTNMSNLIQDYIQNINANNEYLDLFQLLILFFQKGSKIHMIMDDFNPKSILIPELIGCKKSESGLVPNAFGFTYEGMIEMFKALNEFLNTNDMPIITNLMDLLENHFKTDFVLYINLPFVLSEISFKTSGLKQFFERIKAQI